MKMALKILICLVVSIGIGIGSAIAVMIFKTTDISRQNGPWKFTADAGSVDADMYSRAIIARIGLLALKRSETIYFSATTDSAGKTLQDNCQYKVSGISPPARWWSLTVYGKDHFLIPNPDNLYAHTASSLGVSQGGRFAFTLSPTKVQPPWIPIAGAGNPNMILRLYGPKGDARHAPDNLSLPTIKRGVCS